MAFSSRRAALVDLALLTLLVTATAWTFRVGYIASDDGQYVVAAKRVVEGSHDEAFGRNHQNLRAALVLPMAAAFALFGESEWTAILPTTLYFYLLVAAIYGLAGSIFGRRTAVLTSGMLVLTPAFATHASMAGVDIPLLVFVVGSCWLVHAATDSRRPGRLLFAAGVTAGMGWLAHETAVILLVALALPFFRGRPLPRSLYLVLVAGFAVVVLAETGFYLLRTGDPLFRISLIREPVRSGLPQVAPVVGYPCEITSNRTACSFLNLFARVDFGLLFYGALAAGFSLWWSPALTPLERRSIAFVAVLGVLWFLLVVHVIQLKPRPRFFLVPAASAILVTAVWLRSLRASGRVKWSTAIFAVLIATNMGCLLVMERNPLFGERALVEFASQRNEPVYTDPRIVNRAEPFLRWAGSDVEERVLAAPPPPGSLFFHFAPTASAGIVAGGETFDSAAYREPREAELVWRAQKSSALSKLVGSDWVSPLVPSFVRRKLESRAVEAKAFRVPAAPAAPAAPPGEELE